MTTLTTEQIEAAPSPKISRRSFLKRTTVGAGVVAIGLAGYAGLIEPNEIDVTRIEMKLSRLPEAFHGFKIALISDLHYGPYTGDREIHAAVLSANELKPDLVAILGDFVTESLLGITDGGAHKAVPCAEILGKLKSPLGSFAVLGNHDYATNPDFVATAMTLHGISMLRNRSHSIEREGSRIWLIGVNSATYGHADLERSLAGVPQNEMKILLAHEPDFADVASRFGIDAQFSGHSHGGQILVPGLHPLWLPPLANKYYRGYYRVRDLQLYTNRGIGTVTLPFRFCASPEVTLVTLRPA